MALDQKDFIEDSLKANEEKAKLLSIADLADAQSAVYKAPESEKKEPAPRPEAKPKIDNEGYLELSTLRTYHGDVADAVSQGGLSMIKVAAQEQSKKRNEIPEEQTKESKKHMVIAIAASVLFVIGIGAVIFAFLSKQQPTVVIQAPVKKDIISADSAVSIDITSLSSREIQNSIASSIKPNKEGNTITKIDLTRQESGIKNSLSVIDFLSVIGSSIPDILNRSLVPNNYMVGIWSGRNRAEPFLIMQTSSQETAFPGMLEWEKTMAFDLEPIMGEESIAPGYSFVDQAISSHDCRALSNGKNTVFFYTVIGGKTIVIAKSADALNDILNKLRASAILN